MNLILYYIGLVIVLLVTELLYFRVARKFNILDKPNQRSSHQNPTIRGGGIIFFVAILIWFLFNGLQWPWMLMGMMAVALISFLDDLKPRPAYLRFFIHLVAVLLIFFQTGFYDWSWMLVLLALIICIGALNAFNFMDGINGMTGLYALLNLLGFYVIYQIVPFSDPLLLGTLIVSVIVFLFFNFKSRATCFAGDVGSVTIALIQIFILLQLIIATNNFLWVIMFLVYGIDSVVTILYRLKRRENIFKPHRTHLYQYLVNEFNLPHLLVASIYGVTQLSINLILILFLLDSPYWYYWGLVFLVVIIYIVIREIVLARLKIKGFLNLGFIVNRIK